MVKGKVIFEDEEKVEIKYPCFELKDIVEYYFEIKTPGNSINPFSIIALPSANIVVSKDREAYFNTDYSRNQWYASNRDN